MLKVELIEKEQLNKNIPEFNPGDTVKVHFKVFEGGKERIQVIQGTVLKKQKSSVRGTFTLRKISFGIGVEVTFPLHSPKISKIEVIKKGKVRRAKLYYLRGRKGKATRIREKRT